MKQKLEGSNSIMFKKKRHKSQIEEAFTEEKEVRQSSMT